MANIKSAIKRIVINERQRKTNKSYRSSMKTAYKRWEEALVEFHKLPSETKWKEVVSYSKLTESKIDKLVKKNIIHKNTAARKKSNLFKRMNKFRLET